MVISSGTDGSGGGSVVTTTGGNPAGIAGAQKYFDAAQRIATFVQTIGDNLTGSELSNLIDTALEYELKAIELMPVNAGLPGDTSNRPPIDGESRPK